MVSVRHRLGARPRYPFPLELSVEYRPSPAGLTVTLGATNVGAEPCPFGAGAHPDFMFPGVDVAAVELCVQASEWLSTAATDSARSPRATPSRVAGA